MDEIEGYFVTLPNNDASDIEQLKASVKVLHWSEFAVEGYPHWVDMTELSFVENGNPIHALESFMYVIENGYYPSSMVLKWIYDAFSKYKKSSGTITIDRCLGLTGKPATGSTAIKKATKDGLDCYLAGMMNVLNVVFGKTVGEAAELIHKMANAQDSDASLRKHISGYEIETLIHHYQHGWKKYRKEKGYYSHWDDTQKSEFIRQFE